MACGGLGVVSPRLGPSGHSSLPVPRKPLICLLCRPLIPPRPFSPLVWVVCNPRAEQGASFCELQTGLSGCVSMAFTALLFIHPVTLSTCSPSASIHRSGLPQLWFYGPCSPSSWTIFCLTFLWLKSIPSQEPSNAFPFLKSCLVSQDRRLITRKALVHNPCSHGGSFTFPQNLEGGRLYSMVGH